MPRKSGGFGQEQPAGTERSDIVQKQALQLEKESRTIGGT